jgi:hypothetical protein
MREIVNDSITIILLKVRKNMFNKCIFLGNIPVAGGLTIDVVSEGLPSNACTSAFEHRNRTRLHPLQYVHQTAHEEFHETNRQPDRCLIQRHARDKNMMFLFCRILSKSGDKCTKCGQNCIYPLK